MIINDDKKNVLIKKEEVIVTITIENKAYQAEYNTIPAPGIDFN